jgi:peptidoglycan hydrolase-like protein with peptidoglycan-binding domain
MSEQLSASVGNKGSNVSGDVEAVQRLLLQYGFKIGKADGDCGPKTIGAIVAFQKQFLKVPDGLVSPGGLTWHHLTKTPTHGHPIIHVSSPFTRLVPCAPKKELNPGLHAANNDYMTAAFGSPRDTYSDDCQSITNQKIKGSIVVGSVGKFRVQGFRPAIDSLNEVFAEIETQQPDLYAVLGTAGMLCCRYVRNSTTKISNHSWGTAIDLTTAGVLDKRGDGLVQYGMTLVAPIFNSFGWYWGAAFPVEDGMHFEASKKLIDEWKKQLK